MVKTLATLLVTFVLPSAMLVGVSSMASVRIADNTAVLLCGGQEVGSVNKSIAHATGYSPFEDPKGKCLYNYMVRYSDVQPGYRGYYGQDLYCLGVKVGSVDESLKVEEGFTAPILENGEQGQKDGCSFHITAN